MARSVNPDDVIRLGEGAARFKASVSKKRWKQFVKKTHDRGFTVAGQLSGNPDPLKERTPSSLRKEAERNVAAAYKPVLGELSQRSAAAGFLEQKRATDDAAYNTWMKGETDKLDAQSAAADATLTSQQSKIAADLETARKAAAVDSLKRVQGGISDPSQSTALDMSAADEHSRSMVADARTHSAAIAKIGDDAGTISRAALLASTAARQSASRNEVWKEQAAIAGDRTKTVAQMAADAADAFTGLKDKEVTKAQNNREYGLASGQLGVKQQGIQADLVVAKQKYKLETKKFNLARWTAKHKDRADALKRQIDYDKIASTEGQKAADRALKTKIHNDDIRQKRIESRDKGAGIDPKERDVYRDTETARGLIGRWHAQGKDPMKLRQHLRNLGVSEPMIDVANDLYVNKGSLSAHGRAKARRLGVLHPGYFW